jgi:hypothetical protein
LPFPVELLRFLERGTPARSDAAEKLAAGPPEPVAVANSLGSMSTSPD